MAWEIEDGAWVGANHGEASFWEALHTLVSDATDAHLQLSFFGDRVVLHLSGLSAEGRDPDEVVESLHDAMAAELEAGTVAA